MKYRYFLVLTLAILVFLPHGAGFTGALCEGTKHCGDGVFVSCEKEIPEGGQCRINNLPNGVECIAYNADGTVAGSKSTVCEPDNGAGGEGCDLDDPLYWVYCDPFAM